MGRFWIEQSPQAKTLGRKELESRQTKDEEIKLGKQQARAA